MQHSKSGFMAGMVAVALVALTGTARAEDWKLGVALVRNAGGGVRIARIFDGSPAQAVGLRPGHVILTIDGTLYNDPHEVRNKVFNESSSSLNIVYQEGGSFYQVTAELEVVAATPAVEAYGSSPGSSPRKVTKIQAKGLKRKKVSDPRR
ncbi:MAG: PDZ domain-containing protein [Gemmataceae bacterium]